MTEINFNAIKLTQALVKFRSITPEDDGALLVVQDHLSSLGFNCTPLSFSGNGSYEVKNLFATIGSEGPHLAFAGHTDVCLLYTSPSPRDATLSRMPSSA